MDAAFVEIGIFWRKSLRGPFEENVSAASPMPGRPPTPQPDSANAADIALYIGRETLQREVIRHAGARIDAVAPIGPPLYKDHYWHSDRQCQHNGGQRHPL